jgi:hypothetical protein
MAWKMWKRLAAATVLIATGAGVWLFLSKRPAIVDSGGAILSPDGHKAIEVAEQAGFTRIWLISAGQPGDRSLLLTLNPEESARNVSWSPDGRLAAFECFDAAGHSPMTTTHVWVADAVTRELRELKLPPPNERFSTYLEGWVGTDTLKLRATLLERPDDLFFLYSYAAGEIHGPLG